MPMQKLTKKLAQKLLKVGGESRGVTIKTDWEFVLREKGEESLRKLEKKMAEVGCPLKYEEIKAMDFYPLGYDAVSILAIKEILDLDEKGVERLGRAAVKFSLLLKIFMRYFASVQLLAKQAPEMWRKHYTVGDLEVAEVNEKERYAVLRLKNFLVHPTLCLSFKGYFSKILEMATNAPAICEETSCAFRGDNYHEFLIKWK